MKIMIISDTHRYLGNFYEALEQVGPVDQILHLGDVEGDEEEILVAAHCPVAFVAGNNDYFSAQSQEREFALGGLRFFMTHGHHYGVSLGVSRLLEEGRSRCADVVLFGHTHRPFVEQFDSVYVANPGSLSYPRQKGRQPSWLLLEMGPQKKLEFTLHYLE